MDGGNLMWGMLFGSVGLGFWMYGRKQKQLVPWLSGLGLMLVPYFVSNTWVLLALGAALCALPRFVRY
jgi:hypothetical protein